MLHNAPYATHRALRKRLLVDRDAVLLRASIRS